MSLTPDRLRALEVEVAAWLVAEGLNGSSVADLLSGFSERLLSGGFPLDRTYLAMATINPEFRAVNVTWRRGTETTREDVGHDRFPNAFAASPIAHLIESGLPRRRWRLDRAGGTDGFELLAELRREGYADYVAEVVAFGARSDFAVQGVALTACTRAEGGFSDQEVAALSALTQPLALAVYRIALFDLADDLLGAYLGRDAGRRVLNGEIRRGAGHSVEAALMVADLAGFTAVAETANGSLVARLGLHLAAMVEPIEQAGGEVLKFMGDGLLAGFVIDGANPPGRACAAALRAAREAVGRSEAVDRSHPGGPSLPLEIGLHCGEVFYGNVGAGSRLDFTVIGPAVNEASRLEVLCGPLGRRILMSAAFAERCGLAAESLGPHRLKGVAEPREIFALPGY